MRKIEKELLDENIIIKFEKLNRKLNIQEKEFIHLKSVENFIFHLVLNPKIKRRNNYKLQKIGEIRMKKKLLDYFEEIEKNNISKKSGMNFYSEYIREIGVFMNKYYDFKFTGKTLIPLTILSKIIVGVILDIFLSIIFETTFFYTTISFLIIGTFHFFEKKRRKKIYGIYY